MLSRLPALATALLTLTLLGGCGDDTGSGEGLFGSDEPSAESGASSGVSCEYPQDTAAPASKEVEPPPAEATQSGGAEVTIATNSGDIGATLDADAAPCTVNSFLSLAEQGYFDDTPCHRITVSDGFSVLQCGDPSGTGGGGPGYTFADELTGQETYTAGTLAMANAGPDTNGSQFFVVYGDTQLAPDYTVFGSIDQAGIDVASSIAQNGTEDGAPDGAPKEPVTIESVE